MRILVTQPLALGGNIGFWKRLHDVDAWVALGAVQHTATISNGDGTSRKTGQAHIRLQSGWAGLSIKSRMLSIWTTPFGDGPWIEPLLGRAVRELPSSPLLNSCLSEMFATLPRLTLGESSFECAQVIAGHLDVQSGLFRDDDYPGCSTERSQRLIDLVRAAGGDTLVCGAGTRAYLDKDLFDFHGVRVELARPVERGDELWVAMASDRSAFS